MTATPRDATRLATLADGLPAGARARLHGVVADLTDEASAAILLLASDAAASVTGARVTT